MHYQGFPTSNHYGATADGLILGYRAGAPLLYQDTIQYHPTGVAFPSQIFGALVTEKVRSLGAQLVNIEGEAFMHPLETRDVAAAGIIRECTAREKGVTTPLGSGVWLDTPMIELLGGEGTIEKRIPAMLRMYLRYDIDMRKVPILVYPTLHYQNGQLASGYHRIWTQCRKSGSCKGKGCISWNNEPGSSCRLCRGTERGRTGYTRRIPAAASEICKTRAVKEGMKSGNHYMVPGTCDGKYSDGCISGSVYRLSCGKH